jgi:hypothetical protein
MKSDAERCAEYEKFKQIDAAFRAGDLAALRAAVDAPASVPKGPMRRQLGRASNTRFTTARCHLSARCWRSAPIPILRITPDSRP